MKNRVKISLLVICSVACSIQIFSAPKASAPSSLKNSYANFAVTAPTTYVDPGSVNAE